MWLDNQVYQKTHSVLNEIIKSARDREGLLLQGHMRPYSIMPAHIPDQGFKVRSSKQIEEYTIKLNPDPVNEGGSHKIVYSGKKKHTSFNLRLWF